MNKENKILIPTDCPDDYCSCHDGLVDVDRDMKWLDRIAMVLVIAVLVIVVAIGWVISDLAIQSALNSDPAEAQAYAAQFE